MPLATDVSGAPRPLVPKRTGAPPGAFASAQRVLRGFLRVVRQVVGAPDYSRYLEHHAACHPCHAPLSPREYYRDFVTWQFGSGGPTRCC
jgi:uncharacterized short protein YbdD (DUF466 family)